MAKKSPLKRVKVYNPLDLENLGDSIRRAIEPRQPMPLVDMTEFEGAGLYLLYSTGDTQPFPAYTAIERANRNSYRAITRR